ncbi:18076_t:CDS:2 [Funneliformis geosporum]|uniref:7059_t:CDS:1 n=1 Tax=Funneliformis geosporum TaxID=1117311 RepID=A0A9W4SIP9_9GLOM|nr:18076_t:CDS:2 [Funneliformis geosporum]CAI2170906.1 7059_t:CDS:2 [Funneliformis geosporum]
MTMTMTTRKTTLEWFLFNPSIKGKDLVIKKEGYFAFGHACTKEGNRSLHRYTTQYEPINMITGKSTLESSNISFEENVEYKRSKA